MATQLQIRRGTAAQIAAFTGAEGEIVYNSTNDSLHTNDGATAGGFELARADLNNVSDANLNAALTGNTLSALTITTLTATGGTVNGTVIGGTTAAAISGTTGQFGTSLNVDGTVTADGLTVDGAATVTANLDVGADNGLGGKLSIQTSSYGVLQDMRTLVAGGINPYLTISSSADGITFEENGSQYKSLMFKTGATERLRIDSDGNVGIGTSSPTTALQVGDGTGTANWLRLTGTVSDLYIGQNTALAHFGQTNAAKLISAASYPIALGTANAFPVIFGTNDTERMRIDASGNVGIGTSSPQEKTHSAGRILSTTQYGSPTQRIGTSIGENGNTRADIDFRRWTGAAANHGVGMIDVADTGVMAFYTDNKTSNTPATTERMRIDASGNLIVGTTSSAGKLTVRLDSTTASPLFIVNAAISGKFATFEGNGAVHGSITWSGSTTSYNTSSDQRLKENIADADDAGNKIDAIQVRKFDWKADGSHQDYGMIAQELQTVAPEAVSGDADSEEMMGVDYSKLVPMLIKEIQSLRNRVAQLEE